MRKFKGFYLFFADNVCYTIIVSTEVLIIVSSDVRFLGGKEVRRMSVLDKLIFLFCGLILLLFSLSSFFLPPVIVFLYVLTVLALDELLDFPWFSCAAFFLGVVPAFFLPELLFFLPALAYPLAERRRTPLFLSAVLPAVTSSFFQEPSACPVLLSLLFFLSLLLGDRQQQNKKLSENLIRLRDTDKEEQLSLREQAQTLLENQDARIKIATLQERTRIAREIHDNVGHLLSRSLLQVGAMLAVNKQDESLLLLKDSLDDAMEGIRNSVHDLRDDAMDLEISTRHLLSSCSGYRTFFEYDISPEVPVPVMHCFFMITKEALSNIVKHSSADTIRVSMKEYTSLYRLSIADNGRDAVLPEQNPGMGLENMRVRVASLNGSIRFSVQNGFHIFASVPKEG